MKELTEAQQMWIDALKSGQYKQISSTLGGPDLGYCCLGVACVLYEHSTGDKLPTRKRHDGYVVYDNDSLSQDFKKVVEWLGIQNEVGEPWEVNEEFHDLAELNDIFDKTFEGIAEIVETYPDWYFS